MDPKSRLCPEKNLKALGFWKKKKHIMKKSWRFLSHWSNLTMWISLCKWSDLPTSRYSMDHLKILLKSINSFSAVIIKEKVGQTKILKHEIHVSDTNHIISNEKTVLNYEKSLFISTLYVMKILLCCSAESRFLLSVDEDNMTKQPGVHAFCVLDK